MLGGRVLLGVGLLLAGCSGGTPDSPTRRDGYYPPYSFDGYPVSEVEKDTQPPFRIDPTKPFRIEFGRGSGMHGLATVKVSQDGTALLHRRRSGLPGEDWGDTWEWASLRLSQDAMAKLLEAVDAERLMDLERAYHAAVMDGTQWVLWIKQGEREKSVYFNNHFPRPIIRFAERLDALLLESPPDELTWTAVPASESMLHHRDLWMSIRR